MERNRITFVLRGGKLFTGTLIWDISEFSELDDMSCPIYGFYSSALITIPVTESYDQSLNDITSYLEEILRGYHVFFYVKPRIKLQKTTKDYRIYRPDSLLTYNSA